MLFPKYASSAHSLDYVATKLVDKKSSDYFTKQNLKRRDS